MTEKDVVTAIKCHQDQQDQSINVSFSSTQSDSSSCSQKQYEQDFSARLSKKQIKNKKKCFKNKKNLIPTQIDQISYNLNTSVEQNSSIKDTYKKPILVKDEQESFQQTSEDNLDINQQVQFSQNLTELTQITERSEQDISQDQITEQIQTKTRNNYKANQKQSENQKISHSLQQNQLQMSPQYFKLFILRYSQCLQNIQTTTNQVKQQSSNLNILKGSLNKHNNIVDFMVPKNVMIRNDYIKKKQVQNIIGRAYLGSIIFYLVHFKNRPVQQSTWQKSYNLRDLQEKKRIINEVVNNDDQPFVYSEYRDKFTQSLNWIKNTNYKDLIKYMRRNHLTDRNYKKTIKRKDQYKNNQKEQIINLVNQQQTQEKQMINTTFTFQQQQNKKQNLRQNLNKLNQNQKIQILGKRKKIKALWYLILINQNDKNILKWIKYEKLQRYDRIYTQIKQFDQKIIRQPLPFIDNNFQKYIEPTDRQLYKWQLKQSQLNMDRFNVNKNYFKIIGKAKNSGKNFYLIKFRRTQLRQSKWIQQYKLIKHYHLIKIYNKEIKTCNAKLPVIKSEYLSQFEYFLNKLKKLTDQKDTLIQSDQQQKGTKPNQNTEEKIRQVKDRFLKSYLQDKYKNDQRQFEQSKQFTNKKDKSKNKKK